MTFLVTFFAFILAWAFVGGNSIRRDKILFLQKSSGEDNGLLLVMTWTENEEDMKAGCEIFTDEGLINKNLASNDSQIRTLPEYEMEILLGDCLEFNHRRRKRDVVNTARGGISAVDAEYDYDELSRSNRRGSSGRRYSSRRESRNRAPNTRTRERGSKSNKTITITDTSTTVSLNEISDEHGEGNKQRETCNKTPSKSELERESEDSFDPGDKQRGSCNKTSSNSELEYESEESIDTTVTTTESSTTPGYDGLPIIFPGTNWCGAGDIAKDYDDLGTYDDTDKCCRAHDHCNDTLAPGETRNNITNSSPFTKLHCRCDEAFYSCLDNIRSVPANTIGNLYFNVLRRECYDLDYPPAKKCKKYLTLFKVTCLEYEKDMSKQKTFQWISAKRYRRI